jgi:hypothetical protein
MFFSGLENIGDLSIRNTNGFQAGNSYADLGSYRVNSVNRIN